MSAPTHPLMRSIPRGVDTKYFDEQTAPQARFANPYKVLDAEYLHYDKGNPDGKIIIGKIDDQIIGYEDVAHIMTVGRTQSGKSVLIKGNLKTYPGSTLSLDPKGSNAKETAKDREKMGHKVFIADPYNVVTGYAAKFRCTYNLMKRLTLENPFVVEDSLQIAKSFIKTTGQESEPHWDEAAMQLIQSVILLVAFIPGLNDKDRNLIKVKFFLNRALSIISIPDPIEEDTTKDVWFLLNEAEECQKFYKDHENKLMAGVVEAMMFGIKELFDKAPSERSGVLGAVNRHTKLLSFPSMANVLVENENTFEFSDYKEGDDEVDVYLVLPASMMEICSRWLSGMIEQFCDTMERYPKMPKIPILMVLDEFPILGHSEKMLQGCEYLTDFGVRIWFVIQARAQGKTLYKERWGSIEGSCSCKIFFANSDDVTTDYVSKKMGQTLVQQARTSEVTVDQIKQGLSGNIINLQAFPLMTPNEFEENFARKDPQKRVLVFLEGKNPMILERYEYYRE